MERIPKAAEKNHSSENDGNEKVPLVLLEERKTSLVKESKVQEKMWRLNEHSLPKTINWIKKIVYKIGANWPPASSAAGNNIPTF